MVRRLTQPTLKLEELNMPGPSRNLEGIDNLAFIEDIQPDIRIRISSSNAQAGVESTRTRSQTLSSWNRSGQVASVPSPLPMPLSPSLLVSEDPSGPVNENERHSQTITPPLTPSRKRPLPPWLRRSLAQSHHSPYSLWPSIHQREITPLSSTAHNVRFRSFNTSTMNVSPRLSSVSNNQWQRRSTSSMPSKFV